MQNKILPIALDQLSNTLGTEVTAQEMDFDFFEEFSLQNIYIKGANSDTLLYAESLNIDFSVFSLFDKKIFIDDIKLQGARIYLNDKKGNSNYQHILDHLDKNESTSDNAPSESSSWTFGLDDIILDDLYLSMPGTTSDIELTIPELTADLTSFPGNFDSLRFNNISSTGLSFSLVEKSPSTNSGKTEFPTLPFYINVSELDLVDASIIYDKGHIKRRKSGFDANHIDITNANLNVSNLEWGNEISGKITGLNLKDESGIELQSLTTTLKASDQNLSLTDLSVQTPDSKLDLNFESNYTNFDDFINKISQQKVTADIRQMDIAKRDIIQFLDPSQVSFINLKKFNRLKYSGQFSIENEDVKLSNTQLNIDENLLITGSLGYYSGIESSYSINLDKIRTTQDYLTSIFPSFKMPSELKNLGKLNGSINASGNDKKITVTDINLQSGQETIIVGRGTINSLDKAPDFWLDFYFDNLKMNPNNLLQGESIPKQLYNLGNLDYKGSVKGNASNLTMDGALNTDIGNANLDASIEFNSNYSDASYKGDFDLDAFDIGKLLQDTTFGTITAAGSIDGQGLTLDDLNASMNIKSEKAEYNGETYEDILVRGLYANNSFTGRVISNDDKIKLNFDGVANLNGAKSNVEFTSTIERLDLTQFGIGDSLFWVSGIVKGALKGDNLDNFLGKGTIENLKIGTQNGVYKSDSTLTFIAKQNNENSKTYSLSSSFVDAKAEGTIQLSKVARVLEEYFKNYIPVESGFEESAIIDTTLFDNQKFSLNVRTKDINPILEVLIGDKVKLEEASLSGNFSSEESKIDFKGSVDSLVYGDYVIEKGSYFFDGRRDFINGNIILDNITDGTDILINEANILADLNSSVASLNLELFDETDEQTLLIGGDISRTSDYLLNFHDTLIINQSKWSFSPYNEITYGKDGLFMQDLSISKGDQAITAYTDENENGQAIEILMDNFILSELTSIVGKENDYFEGEINGAAIINNVWGKPFVTADVSMKNIMLEEYAVGVLKVEATQKTESNTVVTKMQLKGPQNDAELDLTYGITDRSLSGVLDMTRLEVTTLDPFLTDILIDSKGAIVGKIDITGTPTEPKLNGVLNLVNVQTTPVFTNSRYAILDQAITIDNESISFGDMVVVDENNNVANLTGQILHTNMSEMYLDLNIDTDQFLFLNTSAVENPLFYGNVTVKAAVSISGPIEDIKIDGVATAVNNSKLAISPFSVDQLDYETDFIIYADPRKISLDSLIARSKNSGNTFPFDVDLKLTVGEDSEFEMVMDPVTGDNIIGRGNANLVFNLKKTGDIELFGTYTVTQGKYLFSYGLISKEFDIKEGGRVVFNGDPLNGTLDVTAIYKANTAVYDLLIQEVESLSDTEIADAKRKRNVNVVLNLANSISSPEITMDITYEPSSVEVSSVISEHVIKKLESLRSDPNEMNNQVFGLLLFDNFISTSSSDTDFAQTGTNLAINSLSGLVTNQLNKLANGLIKGVDLNFDVNSYSSDLLSTGNSGLVTELGVGISKRLFNDRLTLSAGTNVDLESSSSEALFNNLAGDFVISYKLTEDGKFNIKVFRKSNYDAILDENASKNGIGLNVRREFGSVKKNKN